jgi:hypothetical protein
MTQHSDLSQREKNMCDGTVRHMHAAAVAATLDYRALRLRLARVILGANRQCIYRRQPLS